MNAQYDISKTHVIKPLFFLGSVLNICLNTDLECCLTFPNSLIRIVIA